MMPKAKMSDNQWIRFIKEGRSSGMSDKDWCIMHDIHPSTLYKVIKRLRKKACEIPNHEETTVSLKQEIVEVASMDENGVITKPHLIESGKRTGNNVPALPSIDTFNAAEFEASVRIVMPSGVKVEMSNSANAATIRSILGVLQSV